MPIKYPTEFKVKAIRRYEKGESIKELCKELNISQSTLYHWRKQYCSIQTDTRTYTPAEFDAISRRLRKVEHELEVIRLSGYIARKHFASGMVKYGFTFRCNQLRLRE